MAGCNSKLCVEIYLLCLPLLLLHMQGLVVASRDCDGYPLSALNSQLRTLNRPLDGVQPLANSVGKIEAYITLIQRTLRAEHNDGMQALQDVLRGVVQDLYLLVRTCKAPLHACNVMATACV